MTENAASAGYWAGYAATLSHDKEAAQVRYAIDRFFGTENGWKVQEEVVNEVNSVGAFVRKVINKAFLNKPEEGHKNVFDELARLRLMLCGGAINSTFTNAEINDLDFYLRDPQLLPEAKAFLAEWFPVDHIETINAVTMKRKSAKSNKKWTIQLITKFSGEPSQIFDWFDFTITHGAYCFDTKEFCFGERFFPDLAKRRLVYSGASKYPICAMYRTNKYVKRGYELPGSTIMHIALSIVQLRIENCAQLKEQLMGIDTMYLRKVLDKYNPENPVNYGEFIAEAFKTIDRITSLTAAEEEDK